MRTFFFGVVVGIAVLGIVFLLVTPGRRALLPFPDSPKVTASTPMIRQPLVLSQERERKGPNGQNVPLSPYAHRQEGLPQRPVGRVSDWARSRREARQAWATAMRAQVLIFAADHTIPESEIQRIQMFVIEQNLLKSQVENGEILPSEARRLSLVNRNRLAEELQRALGPEAALLQSYLRSTVLGGGW